MAPTGLECLVVHGRVAQRGRDAAPGRSTDQDRLQAAPFGHPAPDVIDDTAQGHAHRDLDQTAASDLAGQSEGLGALALAGAVLGETLGAVAHDPRHQAERLDVVDQGRLPPEPGLRRIGRAELGHAATPLDGRHQGGLLAAHEGARALHDLAGLQREAALQDVRAQVAAFLADRDGVPDAFCGERVLGADVQIAFVGADGSGRR